MELASGFYFAPGDLSLIRIGYSLRSNFKALNNRLTVGYSLRLRPLYK